MHLAGAFLRNAVGAAPARGGRIRAPLRISTGGLCGCLSIESREAIEGKSLQAPCGFSTQGTSDCSCIFVGMVGIEISDSID